MSNHPLDDETLWTEPEYPPLSKWPSAEDEEINDEGGELVDLVIHRRLRAIAGPDFEYILIRVPKAPGEGSLDVSEGISNDMLPVLLSALALSVQT